MKTATKLSKQQNYQLKTLEEGINYYDITANTKRDKDGQTWRRLKRIEIVVFENLVA